MQRHPFGPTGRPVSRIGQGTWLLDGADRTEAVATLRAGLDAGLTHVDTAEMYGEAEDILGEALAGRRDEAFIVSKVLPSNASRRGTVAACERSLERLRTDRLDAYLLHWRGAIPLAETVAGLEDLKAAGKILAWGVSNFDADDLAELAGLAGARSIACNQVLYHLEERAIEHAVIPWCAENGVAVVAYSPFGHDAFPTPGSAGGKALAAVAARHGATPRQVALAALTREPNVFAIPKTGRPGRARENAGAGDLLLDAQDLANLDAAFPRGPEPRTLPML